MDLKQNAVAVTGATGFIGRYLVRALLERGARTIAVVRDPRKAVDLAAAGAEIRQAELGDVAALGLAFAGVDAVVSNAGAISLGGMTRQQLIQTNVRGTSNVFRALRQAGVRRVVQTSSATVYRAKPGHYYFEGDPLRDEGDWSTPFTHYAVSKACAEREAWRLADAWGIALTTVRPHTVYGAHDRSTFTCWLKRLMALPVSVFPSHLHLPAVYCGDLAEAFCRILELEDGAAGQAYNIAGEPYRYTYWDLMQAYRQTSAKTPRLVLPVPVPLRRAYSIDRARRDLDFRHRPLEEGFRELVRLEGQSCSILTSR
jgi:nucleoside-diphosphate-sugar epimerase